MIQYCPFVSLFWKISRLEIREIFYNTIFLKSWLMFQHKLVAYIEEMCWWFKVEQQDETELIENVSWEKSNKQN